MRGNPARLLFAMLVAVPFLILGACSDSTEPSDSLAGTYTLRSADGMPVPGAAWDQHGELEEILSGSITIGPDDTCSFSFHRRLTDNDSGHVWEEEIDIDSCRYIMRGTLSENTVTLWLGDDDEEDLTGTWNGADTITVRFYDSGILLESVFVFQR